MEQEIYNGCNDIRNQCHYKQELCKLCGAPGSFEVLPTVEYGSDSDEECDDILLSQG